MPFYSGRGFIIEILTSLTVRRIGISILTKRLGCGDLWRAKNLYYFVLVSKSHAFLKKRTVKDSKSSKEKFKWLLRHENRIFPQLVILATSGFVKPHFKKSSIFQKRCFLIFLCHSVALAFYFQNMHGFLEKNHF
jgi:uncharacterized C2H2 Zn-finger protein